MFGISPAEFIALAVVAMLVLGPEKLPRYATDAARFLRTVRRMAANARADVRRELGPEFDNVSLADLNPRTMVRRHLLEPIDLDDLDSDGNGRRGPAKDSRGRAGRDPGRPVRRAAGTAGSDSEPGSAAADDERPPYDPDTT